ncbi:Radical SAM domain protein [hydrothermal vent metagenome]|uniref:Radical SAM domain protein n=1 Tax=hydrothermal vent metagenome TaxID=652676 RepID=A0A3B0TBY7_9ZZZZ
MAHAVAPSFEAIERLAKTRDADVVNSTLVNPANNRGRAAQSNRSGRFEAMQREAFDDGWAQLDPQAPFETVEHKERAHSIITRNSSPDIHFDISINPYRGCAHGCSYCFARPTHAYLGHSAGIDFERDIYIKTNAPELLRSELARTRYRPKILAIGTNTDPYQPVERQHKIMRQLLEIFLETSHPVTITTKSALVVRDLDLLTQLAEMNLVSVTISITSMDHKLSRLMEPRASCPAKRLDAIKILSEAGVPVDVLAAPMIPAINDMELERILDAAAAQGARGAGMIMLRLPGEVKDIFREWLLRHYPDKLSHVLNLVRDMHAGKENDPGFHSRMRGTGAYARILQQRFERTTKRYDLNRKPQKLRTDLFCPPKIQDRQLSLF